MQKIIFLVLWSKCSYMRMIVIYDLKSLTSFINRIVYYFITSFILMIIIIFFFVWDMTQLILSSFSFNSWFFFVNMPFQPVSKGKKTLISFFCVFFSFLPLFLLYGAKCKVVLSSCSRSFLEENFQSSQLSMTKNRIRGNWLFCPHLLSKSWTLRL